MTSIPTWSPDGSHVAFYSTRDGNGDIYEVAIDGTGLTNPTNSSVDDGRPVWSLDGYHIAFYSFTDGSPDVYIMNADGSNKVRLTHGAIAESIAWSPDGTHIAFVSSESGNSEIYIMQTDGTDQVNITNNPAVDINPSWSPDGHMIAFMSRRDENAEISKVNLDWSGLTRLPMIPVKTGILFGSHDHNGRQERSVMVTNCHLNVLRKIDARLRDSGINWVITGSLGMALQGVDIEVHDIDIQTDQRGAYEIEGKFMEYVIVPVRYSRAKQIRSHFGTLEILGVKVEVMGDIQKLLSDQSWEDSIEIERYRQWIFFDGMQIPVLPLEYEYQAYMKLGRVEEADRIRKRIEEKNCKELSLSKPNTLTKR